MSKFHIKLKKSPNHLNLTSILLNKSKLIQGTNYFNTSYTPSQKEQMQTTINHTKSFTLNTESNIHTTLNNLSHNKHSFISKSSTNIFSKHLIPKSKRQQQNLLINTNSFCNPSNPISKAYVSFFRLKKNHIKSNSSFVTPINNSPDTTIIEMKYLLKNNSKFQTSPNLSYTKIPSIKKVNYVFNKKKDNVIKKEIRTFSKKVLQKESKLLSKNKPIVKVKKGSINKSYYANISPINRNANCLVRKVGFDKKEKCVDSRNCGYQRKYKVLKETSIKDKEIEKFLNEFKHVEKNENNEHTDLQSNKQMKRNKSYLSKKANYNFFNKGGNNTNINERIKQMYLKSLFNKSGNNLDDL